MLWGPQEGQRLSTLAVTGLRRLRGLARLVGERRRLLMRLNFVVGDGWAARLLQLLATFVEELEGLELSWV